MTRPFICRSQDGETYFVKGSAAGHRSLICEWVAGCLGRELGLPIAPFEIVDVPAALIDGSLDPEARDLGAGLAFGSKSQCLEELTYASITAVPIQQCLDVLAFDWWIRNEDRNLSELGGNPNLFWNRDSDALCVIDHNSAFDTLFDEDRFCRGHAFSRYINTLFFDWHTRQQYEAYFANALANWTTITESIPDDWRYVDKEMTIPVDFDEREQKSALERFDEPEFWDLP